MAIRKEFNEVVKKEFLNQLDKKECFNCGTASSEFDVHHIVPIALGGTNRLTNLSLLCVQCHGLVHDSDFIKRRELVKKGIAKARRKGVKIGRKPTYSKKQINHALDLLDNHSYTEVTKMTGISRSTLTRARRNQRESAV